MSPILGSVLSVELSLRVSLHPLLLLLFFFLSSLPFIHVRPGSLRAGVVGDSLGSLRYSTLGQILRQQQTHGCLDFLDVSGFGPEYWASPQPHQPDIQWERVTEAKFREKLIFE